MSTIAPGIKSSSPEINSRLFEGQNGNNFWIGRIATLDSIEGQNIYDATSVLRANVYSSLGFIPQENIDNLGRELDKDDARSVHFAVVESPLLPDGKTYGRANVIGTSRLINKNSPDYQLPIEHHFPEAFEVQPASTGTVEVSRLIVRHDNSRTQRTVALALIRAMTHYSIAEKIEADYCMVEAPLLRLLNGSGIPTAILGETKKVAELGGDLIPVKIEAFPLLP
ncbi:GNAT family N-acetyltransferase, partial [Candidatus Saccharibacteria bacterium]|nr:GNAT family N-acetyltransferase [Candidatus Saccharibacteria bacterium]